MLDASIRRRAFTLTLLPIAATRAYFAAASLLIFKAVRCRASCLLAFRFADVAMPADVYAADTPALRHACCCYLFSCCHTAADADA